MTKQSKPKVVDLMEALEESLKRAKAYEPCVIDADGCCTRWSHNHVDREAPRPG